MPGLVIRISAASPARSRCSPATEAGCGGSDSGAIRMFSWKRRGRSRRSIAAASLTARIPHRREADGARAGRQHGAGAIRAVSQPEGPAQLVRSPPDPGEGNPADLAHRRVADIRRRDVRELVEQKAQTAPIQSNRVLDRISALLTFAVDQDWIEANPAWRIKKPGPERSRDRVLTRDERREPGTRSMRLRPRTLTGRRRRDSRRRSTMFFSSCCSRHSAAGRCAK